jgi:hypothetical protein
MAPSAAICITSWQPFADGVGLGGRHSRAGCFPRGEKERAPALLRICDEFPCHRYQWELP